MREIRIAAESNEFVYGWGKWVVRRADAGNSSVVGVSASCSDGSGVLIVSFVPEISVCLVCSPFNLKYPPVQVDRTVYTVDEEGRWQDIREDEPQMNHTYVAHKPLQDGYKVMYAFTGTDAVNLVNRMLKASEKSSAAYVRIGQLRNFKTIDDRSWFSFIHLDGLVEARLAAMAWSADASQLAAFGGATV